MLESRRVFTGGLYGFFTSFSKTVRETRATHVAFCLDMKPYVRSQEYPDYKQFRKGNADPELLRRHRESLELIMDCLEDCGLSLWGVPGFESDDLIGHAVKVYRHRFDDIYAASNDSDLYQLFDAENFHVYSSDVRNLWNGKRLAKEHGVSPAEFMLSTALTGTHNDIEGIHKVGPVTALKAIRDPALMRKYRDSHGDLIDRNLKLIKLPHELFPRSERLPMHASGGFNPRRLYRFLGRYDIDVTNAMVSAIEQLLPR